MLNLFLALMVSTTLSFAGIPLLTDETKMTMQSPSVSLSFLLPSDALVKSYERYQIKHMLQEKALRAPVIDKVMQSLDCADKYGVEHTPIVTVIDYALPSNQKRFWVFDLKKKKVLFHTYVSHGIKSGLLRSEYFSNKHNSKASSIGVFKTKQSYYGRHGLAMRLKGLEPHINDYAEGRSIVMHGGWYMEEPFIKKYGRPGRSWGCPAIPKSITKHLINTIKGLRPYTAVNSVW
jgi:hypothetical protein